DKECPTGLCNWKLQRCASPGSDGTPCQRDEECASNVCNWKLEACSVKGGPGAACMRDDECASGTCGFAASSWLSGRAVPARTPTGSGNIHRLAALDASARSRSEARRGFRSATTCSSAGI